LPHNFGKKKLMWLEALLLEGWGIFNLGMGLLH
jgi:hypothetical protein